MVSVTEGYIAGCDEEQGVVKRLWQAKFLDVSIDSRLCRGYVVKGGGCSSRFMLVLELEGVPLVLARVLETLFSRRRV